MTFTPDSIYALLPAVVRLRDAGQGYPLKALIGVIADQASVLQEDIQQLYDDQFIETCSEWAVPYIGDLVGAQGLDPLPGAYYSLRSQVANTIGYRRRKGTPVMLEQLARDVTGWDAHIVEYFQLLVTTQYVNHLRPNALLCPDLRLGEPLQYVGTPFDTIPRLADVRRISSNRGLYNIPNIGVFLFRQQSYTRTGTPAYALADGQSFTFDPLGNNINLFSSPRTEAVFQQLATPENVALPLLPLVLNQHLDNYYGPDLAFVVIEDSSPVLPNAADPTSTVYDVIEICDLSAVNTVSGVVQGWKNIPTGTKIAVDPTLGRIAFPTKPTGAVTTQYHYGFSIDIGGGEYSRLASFNPSAPTNVLNVPSQYPTLSAAATAAAGNGLIVVSNNGTYTEVSGLTIAPGPNQAIEIRAADLKRPAVIIGDPHKPGINQITITGAATPEGAPDVALNGLVISGGSIHVSGYIRTLTIEHCTLVPGLTSAVDVAAPSPIPASLIIDSPDCAVTITSSILGAILSTDDAKISITGSIIDAGSESGVAYAALDSVSGGAPLTAVNTTVRGLVHARYIDVASDSIFLATPPTTPPWQGPVRADDQQQGCVRFCYLPLSSLTPRQYRCRPNSSAEAASVAPEFVSFVYGNAGYGQLSRFCSQAIRSGADDGSEMGAGHDLYAPQREANLEARMQEYLRFSMEAGIFEAS